MSRSTERRSTPPRAARMAVTRAGAAIAAVGATIAAAATAIVTSAVTVGALARKAWDIDVRADFKGLPAGSGSVAKGQDVWEAKCANCHGIFGESNEVFSPIVGGTTKDDVRTGRVANLLRPDYPQRTTLMKVS